MKNEKTHIINENGSILGSLEVRCVTGILEVASVLLKGCFVQSLLPRNENVIRNMHKNIPAKLPVYTTIKTILL